MKTNLGAAQKMRQRVRAKLGLDLADEALVNETGLWPRRPGLLATDSDWKHYYERRNAVDVAALTVIGESMGVDVAEDQGFELSLALAKTYHPLFQLEYGKQDARTEVKWTPYRKCLLCVEMDAAIEAGEAKTKTAAARLLVKRNPWAQFVDGLSDPVEALRIQYFRFSQPANQKELFLVAKARKYHQINSDMEAWQQVLSEALLKD